MYADLTIEGLRCFGELKVEPLTRVNLIAGQNNVGKTALLEALWILSHPASPREALRVSLWRDSAEYGIGIFFADLFHKYETGLPINLEAKGINSQDFSSLKVTHQYRSEQPLMDWSMMYEPELGEEANSNFDLENEIVFEHISDTGRSTSTRAWLTLDSGPGRLRPVLRDSRKTAASNSRPCEFQHAQFRHNARGLATLFSRAKVLGYQSSFEDLIRLIEPRLEEMTIITDARGIPSLHGDIGEGQLYPMSVMGEGTKRLLSMSLAFLRAQDGTMLIDEIDNGLHHSILPEVWKTIDWLSREFNVQVFATTHSYECIEAANNAFTELESSELHLHRLHRRGNQVKSVTYSKDALDTNIEYIWELR